MRNEEPIRRASFDPQVKTYWLLSGVIVLVATIVGIPLLLLWIPIGLVLTGRYLDRMECVLTSKSLEVRKGLFVRVEKTIPLEKITDMGLVQGPIMRWLGIDRLTVETAGQSGAGALVSLTGVVQAKEFREAVLTQRDALAEGYVQRGTEQAGGRSPADSNLDEVLASLQRIESLLQRIAGAAREPKAD
jgi:putative membrane protein